MKTTMYPVECEGRMAHYGHTTAVRHYTLYNQDGGIDTAAYLCSRCVEADIRKGYDWRDTEKETTK